MSDRITTVLDGIEISAPRDLLVRQLLAKVTQTASLPSGRPQLLQYVPEWGGIDTGIFPGQNGGRNYHLILPTDPTGFVENIKYGGYGEVVEGARDPFDGVACTRALLESGIDHPAAQWVAALAIDGHSDWTLAAQRELMYLCAVASHLIPYKKYTWSATQPPGRPGYAWVAGFDGGGTDWVHKGGEYAALAVRRVFE